LRTADLNHVRLERRFKLVLDRLFLKPSFKFTAACRGRAEVRAAYRFVNTKRVTAQAILAPHQDATLQRIAQYRVVIVAQDTTETDLTRKHERMTDAGPLNDPNRLGFHLHNLLAMTPQRVPLGVVAATIWARDPHEFGKPSQRKQKPIEQKETFRWLNGYRQACAVATTCPQTQIIAVGDSENDIYECILDGQQPAAGGQRKAEWIIRACHERTLVPDPSAEKTEQAEAEETSHLFAKVASVPVRKRLTIQVSKREPKSKDQRKRKQPRSARHAVVTVQAARVTLQGVRRKGAGHLEDVTVNAVLLREEKPPAGEEPIEWLLLTSLPIDTVPQVLEVVEYYCCRWQIEVYYRVLKSGCQVEKSQLESGQAFQAYLALCLIVAWRVMYVMMLGRECPDLPADAVLEADEWQAVYAVVNGEQPPKTAPPLGKIIKQIASLGGYLGRKGDGPPGPKAMWLGMQRLTDLALGWHARGRQGSPEVADQKKASARAPPSPSQSSSRNLLLYKVRGNDEGNAPGAGRCTPGGPTSAPRPL
jgi:transposase Tn5 family protein/transposase-like protein